MLKGQGVSTTMSRLTDAPFINPAGTGSNNKKYSTKTKYDRICQMHHETLILPKLMFEV
jgi:hypothetical protein